MHIYDFTYENYFFLRKTKSSTDIYINEIKVLTVYLIQWNAEIVRFFFEFEAFV